MSQSVRKLDWFSIFFESSFHIEISIFSSPLEVDTKTNVVLGEVRKGNIAKYIENLDFLFLLSVEFGVNSHFVLFSITEFEGIFRSDNQLNWLFFHKSFGSQGNQWGRESEVIVASQF